MPASDVRAGSRVFAIKTLQIEPNPDQPRQEFEPVSLANLASSLRQHGMLQPIIVRPITPADLAGACERSVGSAARPEPIAYAAFGIGVRYRLIAGERRWRAAQLAGLDEVPALIFNATSPQMLELALVENIQREDLSPLEEARAYEQMIDHLGLTQEEVALRVGRHRTTVANRLRLLHLSAPVRLALNERRITEGHARALLGLDEAGQAPALLAVLRGKLSVRETEQLVRRETAAPPRPRRGPAVATGAVPDEVALEDALRRALGTKVTLSRQGSGGRIVIEFYSEEELQRVYEQIAGAAVEP